MVGLEPPGGMGQFHCLGQQGVLQPLWRPFAGYETMSCWTGLAEPSWSRCNCAGTAPVACDVRGDIARRGRLLCSAPLVTGQMTWHKTLCCENREKFTRKRREMKTVLRKASVSLFPFVRGVFYGSRTGLKEGKRLLVFPC